MKRAIRTICPPVIYNACNAQLRRRYAKLPSIVEGRERDAAYYDATFHEENHWSLHYTRSRYYPLWSVIADRIKRSAITDVIDIGCGTGQFASLLRDQGVPNYLGVDFALDVSNAPGNCVRIIDSPWRTCASAMCLRVKCMAPRVDRILRTHRKRLARHRSDQTRQARLRRRA